MLVFVLEYREAIDEISGDKEMRKYELEEEEWALVKQLCNVLEVRCSSLVSMSVTHVFLDVQRCDPILFTLNAKPRHRDPAMDHIDAHLATVSQDLKFSPAIGASVALGKAHLNKYYNMMDHSEVYRIAMSKSSEALFI
jgi:hypothetical protein